MERLPHEEGDPGVRCCRDGRGKDHVPPEDRIATFDNDCTLWVEYPMYTQVLFAFDRVKKLAPQHPEWKTKQPFKALLEGGASPSGPARRSIQMTGADSDQPIRISSVSEAD